MPVNALSLEKLDETPPDTSQRDHTSYNATEHVVHAFHVNATSQKESSKVVIDFDLPSPQPSSQIGERKKDDDGTTPILKLIINQAEGTIAPSAKTTAPDVPGSPFVDASPESDKEAATSQQHLLIPPASVNASIAQMPSVGGTPKQQGQIIIRWVLRRKKIMMKLLIEWREKIEQSHSAEYFRNSKYSKKKKYSFHSFNLFIHNSFISHSLVSRSS